jgi:GDP-L-fucose synthase
MKNILITGGTGTVGKHLQKIIPHGIFLGRSHENGGDLRDPQYVKWLMSSYSPDVVVHLAAKVGGIQENIQKPAEFFDDNVLINTNVLKYSHQYGVKQFIGILSTCIYPDKVPNYPMTEKDLFLGPPTPTNFSYGYAKRALAVQIDAYNQQYGTKYNYLIPCNLYSEYDNFGNENKMHFITALLHKIKNSTGSIELLGNGTPLRQFMHANDLARVIKEVIDKNITESFNIATYENYSIDEMAKIALKELGLDLKVTYTNPNLNGQFRKDVSSEKLKTLLPDFKFTPFKQGIKTVYDKISK